jgi:hypothetical protein
MYFGYITVTPLCRSRLHRFHWPESPLRRIFHLKWGAGDYSGISRLWNNIVARTWRLYKMGFGLKTGFTGSQYSYSAHTLQLTTVDHNTRLATAPQPVFHCTVSSRLSLCSSRPRTSGRPTHSLQTVDSLSAPTQDRLLLWRLFNPN